MIKICAFIALLAGSFSFHIPNAFADDIDCSTAMEAANIAFVDAPLTVAPTVYINGDMIARNQYIALGNRRYILRDWYGSVAGDIFILDDVRSGKRKIKKATDFKNHRIVIDYVRLKELLEYRNERVINRYVRDFKVSREEAEKTFIELMKWFFLLHKYTSEGHYFENLEGYFILGMYDETQRIDDMWHTFILFTIDYTQFGYDLLGYYQHHQPFDVMKPMTNEEMTANRLKMYQFIYNTLGPATLQSWFVEQNYNHPDYPVGFHVPVPAHLLEDK